MNLRPLVCILFIGISALVVGLSCSSGGGTSVSTLGGSEVVGKCVDYNDSTGLAGTVVSVFPTGADSTSTPLQKDTSDFSGSFKFIDLPTNQYDIYCSYKNDSLVGNQKKIDVVFNDKKLVRTDAGNIILKLPGSLRGKVSIYANDKSEILCYIPGTSYVALTDSLGNFTISNIPPDTYSIKFSYPGYIKKTVNNVVVFPDSSNSLYGAVQLEPDPAGAPPTVQGVAAWYDSANGLVRIMWDKVLVSDLQGYQLFYAVNSHDTMIPGIITDTFYTFAIWSHFVGNPILPMSFMVKAIDNGLNTSAVFSNMVTVTAVSPLPVDQWESDSSLNRVRRFGAAVYANGSIFALGGCFHSANPSSTQLSVDDIEKFDNASHTWKFWCKWKVPRFYMATAQIGDTVYVIGGMSNFPIPPFRAPQTVDHATIERLIFSANTISDTIVDTLPYVLEYASSVVMNGVIYITGGMRIDSLRYPSSAILRYQPATGSIDSIGEMIEPRFGHSSVVADNKIISYGGSKNIFDQSALSSVEEFDLTSGSHNSSFSLATARVHASAIAIGSKVYLCGGVTSTTDATALASVEIFNYSDMVQSSGKPMPLPRQGMSSIFYKNQMYYCGGSAGDIFSPSKTVKSVQRYFP